jgi:uncharacterized protein
MKIKLASGSVSAIPDSQKMPVASLALALGAGAGMNHKFMTDLAAALAKAGFAVLRFQFPYMEAGGKRTDPPAVAAATIAAAVKSLRERMTTTAASEELLPDVRGIICTSR